MGTTIRLVTIGQWLLALVVVLHGTGEPPNEADEAKPWTPAEVTKFANEVLNSINEVRTKYNTKKVTLNMKPEKNGQTLAQMYALTWQGGEAPLEVGASADDPWPWLQVFMSETGKTYEQLKKLYNGALLYRDKDPKRRTGSELVQFADRTRKIEYFPGIRGHDFVNKGDAKFENDETCNTLRKLLWVQVEQIGVYAMWNEKNDVHSYVVLFDGAAAPASVELSKKFTKEAIDHLKSLQCIRFETITANPVVEKVIKEAYEGGTQAETWSAPQLKKFAEEVTDGINKMRKQYGTKFLTLDDDLTKLANDYAEYWGFLNRAEDAKRGQPWVDKTLKQRKKDMNDIELIRDSAILFSHLGADHLKPAYFLRLLKDVNPDSNLLLGKHGFCSDRKDVVIDEKVDYYPFKLINRRHKVYCHRFKQLLWTSTEKIGIGAWWQKSGSAEMHYVIFFEKGRKKFERETGRLTPGAVSFLKENGNQCRMDYARDQSVTFHANVYQEILDLRTAFSVAFGETKPLKISEQLTQQAKEYAKKWAESNHEIDSDTSGLPKGRILYAQQMVVRTPDNIGDNDMHWDENGVVLSYESETTPQDLIKHLLEADRVGAPMPVTFQLDPKPPVSLKPTGVSSTRLRQILCKDATEIGISVWTYVYNYDEQFPGFGHFVVLLFNKECDTMPKLTNDNIVAKLEAVGWRHNKYNIWWHEADLKTLHKFEKDKIVL